MRTRLWSSILPAALLGSACGSSGGDAGVTVTDPNMIGECIWEHETPAGSHQLQVRVWASPQYYNPPADEFTTPLDVGERGYVRSHSASRVDVAWVTGRAGVRAELLHGRRRGIPEGDEPGGVGEGARREVGGGDLDLEPAGSPRGRAAI